MTVRKTKAAKAGSPLLVKPTVIVTDGTPNYYVNNADVSCSPYEFALAFSRLPSKLTVEQVNEAQGVGTLTVEAEVVLLLPPAVIPGLIRALTAQKDVYEQQFAPIYDAGAGE